MHVYMLMSILDAYVGAVLHIVSSLLGGVNKSPSALFVASDGVSLRIYQALLDARSLLTSSASNQLQVLLCLRTGFTAQLANIMHLVRVPVVLLFVD